ncbi:ATP-dependent DNA helicase [Pseudorhodoferax sp. Leaf267]|uniref:ATP-dependent DNA helicase n=1 Tax=Pseudorhodoferax sp. Leaf267 TaxID=1736316 RepID=UPI0006FA2D7B|nr:ATP-dependent DNA helicase [Pseudorhodoferax sp. Leaf267]KQP22367.1 helicase [Pseudorhodoferax sp. Leaf267]
MTEPADALQQQVRAAFEVGGVLSRAADHFLPRQGQIDMALAVARTISQGGALVVEAGTGVGKTFSYLVPALLSGERVLLSTATKTLQDQLFGRDLPRLVAALGLPVRTALLKGRSSYLCLHRMHQARHALDADEHKDLRALAEVERWAPLTRTGDLAELAQLDERSPLMALVSSTRDNCLGAQCPQFRACHVNLARREAMSADVVVVNHHLFFADLAVRESGMAELLPTVRVAVFDEAHQLNETGVQFLGTQMGTGQLLDFGRDLLAAGLQQARGLVDWNACVMALQHAARDLRMLAGPVATGTRLRWHGPSPDGLDARDWADCLHAVVHALHEAAASLRTVTELAPDFGRLLERAQALAERAARFADPGDGQAVRWVDVGLQLRLIESPLDIAQTVQTRLLQAEEDADAAAGGRAWIFTSATLGDDARLRWFTEPCGLAQAEVLQVDSPFDYAAQAAFYVPPALPRPADPGHSAAVAALVGDAAARIGGRTLVLTTTLRALRVIGAALKQQVGSNLDVLVQGEGTKRFLMERFRASADGGRRGGILVASASFWEGVDVPGDALQLLFIDKLPFPPPNDPLVEARTQRIEQAGGSPFKDYFIPETAVALKQGAGRLIRRESDRGVLVICDTRLVQMGYGRRLRAALPPMRQLKDEAEFLQALQDLALTRPSTTESPSA